ncbi:hypothetical protein TKK_0008807 [Trichogramma kaykai]
MSMPNKGKYAHHSHHTQLQNQHILSANQASNSGLSQPPHVQQYSSAILNSNAVRFMANQAKYAYHDAIINSNFQFKELYQCT